VFPAEIPRHSLRREIIATRNCQRNGRSDGPRFSSYSSAITVSRPPKRCERGSQRPACSNSLDAPPELKANAAELTADAELSAFLGLERAARRACTWAIAHANPPEPLGVTIGRIDPQFRKLAIRIRDCAGGWRARFASSAPIASSAPPSIRNSSRTNSPARLRRSSAQCAKSRLRPRMRSDGRRARLLRPQRAPRVRRDRTRHRRQSAATTVGSVAPPRDLAAELSWARIQLCRVTLDRSADGTAEIASITPGRERRAAEVETPDG